MRGDLVEKTAADVCRELAARGASGILAIDGPGGPGRVVFADGRIIAAVSPTPRARLGDRLVGAGELDPDDLANALTAQQEEGESSPLGSLLVERGLVRRDAVRVFVQEQVLDALFEVIRWRYGAFAFASDDEAAGNGVPLSLSVDDALVEVARRQHEWNELSQIIPDLDSVPSFRTGAATASAALEPDEFAVLASVDGVRSVRALAADLGYGEFEAARVVYGLSLLGVVDVRPPQDEIGAALEDALGLGDFESSEPSVPATQAESPAGGPPEGEPEPADGSVPVEEPTSTPGPEEPVPAPPPAATDPGASPEPPGAPDTETPAEPGVDASAEPPATPNHLDVVAGPSEAVASDEPDVWVSPDEPRDPAVDAEVELPADAFADGPADISPDPSSETRTAAEPTEPAAEQTDPTATRPTPAAGPDEEGETVSRWDDLFSAAEQAATDRLADEREPPPTPGRMPTGGSAAPTTGPQPGSGAPPEPRPPAEDQRPADGSPAETSEPSEPSQEDKTSGQRGDDNDVSEFLRELSRLSVDGPSDRGAPKPPVRPSSTSSESDSSKKKRRGLFGRG